MRDLSKYPFELRPLTDEEGGGYLISYLDFNECIADGETIEEAIAAGRDALISIIDTLESKGLPVPAPGSYGAYSGKFVQRLPKMLKSWMPGRRLPA